MTGTRYQELLQLVHNRAGDSFRGAVRYTADDWTMLYVRDDVATDELGEGLDALVERARADEPVVDESIYPGIGETQATVELHELAAVLHFRIGDDEGIVISLDRDVAQGLGQFVNSCNSVLAAD